MMALANLLSHPTLGNATMSGSGLLRSAKDLGRVLGIVRLSPRDQLPTWVTLWETAIREHFPRSGEALVVQLGKGLDAIVADKTALRQAREILGTGLLQRTPPTLNELEVWRDELHFEVIEPLRARFGL